MKNKIKTISSIFLFAIAATALFGLPPLKVLAAEAIMVSPLRFEELVDPGDTLKKSIKIVNNSDSSKVMFAYIRDFKSEGEEGKASLILPGSEDGYFLSSWLDITKEGIAFGPGEEKEISFTINVPASAGPGGYYGAVIFGTEAPNVKIDSPEKGAAIAISQQAGSLILLQIAGDVFEQSSIREFTTDKGVYSSPFFINFSTRIENEGNVHIKPHGTIEVSNLLKKTVATIRVNDKGANVLPKSIRRFDNSWEGDFGFGRYKALLSLSYGTSADRGGQGKQSLAQAVYFWIIPWKIVAPVLFGILFIIVAVYLFLKFYKHKAIKTAMKSMGMGGEYYVKKHQGPSPAFHLGLILTVVLIIVLVLVGVAFFLFF